MEPDLGRRGDRGHRGLFQSTGSRGARQEIYADEIREAEFQSTGSRGARLSLSVILMIAVTSFNPRARVEPD